MENKAVTLSLSLSLLDRLKKEVVRLSEEEERKVPLSEVITKALVKQFPKEKKHGKKK
jgi:hypothetical protein